MCCWTLTATHACLTLVSQLFWTQPHHLQQLRRRREHMGLQQQATGRQVPDAPAGVSVGAAAAAVPPLLLLLLLVVVATGRPTGHPMAHLPWGPPWVLLVQVLSGALPCSTRQLGAAATATAAAGALLAHPLLLKQSLRALRLEVLAAAVAVAAAAAATAMPLAPRQGLQAVLALAAMAAAVQPPPLLLL